MQIFEKSKYVFIVLNVISKLLRPRAFAQRPQFSLGVPKFAGKG